MARFHDFLCLIQPMSVTPDCIRGNAKIDEGNFGTIDQAIFAAPGQQVSGFHRLALLSCACETL